MHRRFSHSEPSVDGRCDRVYVQYFGMEVRCHRLLNVANDARTYHGCSDVQCTGGPRDFGCSPAYPGVPEQLDPDVPEEDDGQGEAHIRRQYTLSLSLTHSKTDARVQLVNEGELSPVRA